jgi:hypothetical protein
LLAEVKATPRCKRIAGGSISMTVVASVVLQIWT